MQVEIYGTAWCASCQTAKKLCETKDIEYTYTDVDDTLSLKKLEERLGHKVKSVPQIFLDGTHLINGFSELQSAIKTAH